jgi:hypothetical protein
MKRWFGIGIVAVWLLIPLLSVAQSYRLSPDDQRRFDSYYSRWLEYKRTNNAGEIASMEKRMRNVMSQYGIPLNTPFHRIVSGGDSRYGGYRDDHRRRGRDEDRHWGRDDDRHWGRQRHQIPRFSADDERRFRSYYSRWQEYKRTNNRGEIISMEKRMQNVMAQYNIPATVSYHEVMDSLNGRHSRWR